MYYISKLKLKEKVIFYKKNARIGFIIKKIKAMPREFMNTGMINKEIPKEYTYFKVTGLENIINKKCFGTPSILICIDEGCTAHSFNGDNEPVYTVNIAGSGILLGVDKVVELFKNKPALKENIKTLTWHVGCGAASLAKKDNPEITADGFVRDLAKKLKEELGMDCSVLEIADPSDKKAEAHLTRPLEYHNAMVLYVNATEKAFNYKKNKLLPPGFTLDYGFFGEETTKGELAVALSIAFGDHGMKEKITEENPFIINYITEKEEEIPSWITDTVKKFESENKDTENKILIKSAKIDLS